MHRPRREGSVWVAPQASLALAFPLSGRFALELRALAARPLVRPRFELDSGSLFHQPDWIVGQLSVGAGWRFHLRIRPPVPTHRLVSCVW